MLFGLCLISRYLQVIEAKMMRDYENDRFKGFAYIEFRTRGDLERALTLNGVVSVTEVIASVVDEVYCCNCICFCQI